MAPPPETLSNQRARACENCNRRKKKCNGTKPQCLLCTQAGLACVYPSFTLKPGPRKGFKRKRPEDSELRENSSSREAAIGTARPISSSNTSSQAIGPQSLSSEDSTTCRPEEHSSNLDPAFETELSQFQIDDSPAKTPVFPSKAFIIHLVKIYFDNVHPQIRLLHQPSFVNWIQNGSFAFDEHATLILTSIFSLAARYSDHPEVDLFDQSLLPRASTGYNTQDVAVYKSRKRWERGKGFLSQAHRLLALQTSELDKAELECGGMQRPPILVVQASIFISFAQLGMGLNSQTYSALSTAVRLAYDCGLNQVDCDDEVAPTTARINFNHSHLWIKKEGLRRAWWAVAYLENFYLCDQRQASHDQLE